MRTGKLLTSTDLDASVAARPLQLSRRALLAGLPLALAGCAGTRFEQMADLVPPSFPLNPAVDPYYKEMYGEISDNGFRVSALPLAQIDPSWLRRDVHYTTTEKPGTVIVDPSERHLYVIGDNRRAVRYGIGVGREGFLWSGTATIKRKAVWPTWTPPAEMIARDARAAEYAGGMPGGPENPLGARALYLYQGDRDTLYRLHGTTDPMSIGTAVSSGCIRLFNQDIIDLHRRVAVGAKVVVLGTPGSFPDWAKSLFQG